MGTNQSLAEYIWVIVTDNKTSRSIVRVLQYTGQKAEERVAH